MNTISIKFLQAQVDRLNTLTGSPMSAYTKTESGDFVCNIGNYHLDGAYGGHSLCRMSSPGGGVTDVFRCGHVSKRDLSNRISAFINGIESTKP